MPRASAPSDPSAPRPARPRFVRLTWLAFALAGCSSAPITEPVFAPHRAIAIAWAEVSSPPPPSQPETVPVAPSPRHVWVDGQWVYQRVTSKWTWEHGSWCIPPAEARFYARSVVMRVRRVTGRTTHWNALEGRYEEVDLADDRWSWAKGRFYTGPSRAIAAPSDEKGECVAPSTP